MSFHHTADKTCLSCEDKLQSAHAVLRAWFHAVKDKYPNVHISWGYRNQADQEQAFHEGKTELHYPHSAHNAVGIDSKPCARALDLFQIDEDGVARFAQLFYAKIADECLQNRDPIKWGGHWKSIGDADHFELVVGE
jgi:hypothetical protein